MIYSYTYLKRNLNYHCRTKGLVIMTYSFFEQDPIGYIIYILFSLIITLVVYGVFPLIMAYSKERTINAKTYKRLCYTVNFFVCFVLGLINGTSLSILPYLLWTAVFVKIGFRTLLYQGLVNGFENLKEFNKEIDSLIVTYKNEFLAIERFDNQDDGVSFFDDVRDEIFSFSSRKTKKTFEYIFIKNFSTEDYLLEYLDKRVLGLIEEGNIDDIIKQKGTTYVLSEIYEFINDYLLKSGRLVQIQHQNKLSYIDYLCEEYTKNRYRKIQKERGKKENRIVLDNNGNQQEVSAEAQGTIFCRKCGAQILIDSMFCNKCGIKVEESNKNYDVCIFDIASHTLRKEMKEIDIIKFPPSKFADNNTYYAIETIRDGKKARIYYTKDNWNKQVELGISKKEI